MLSGINNRLYKASNLFEEFRSQSRLIYRDFWGTTHDNDGFSEGVVGERLEGSSDINSKIDVWREQLALLLEESSQLQAELDGIKAIHLDEQLASHFSIIRDENRLLVSRLRSLSQVGAVLPEILSTQDRKNYYILLQDNQELRPTGGFLQAIAMIVIENGNIVDHQVFTTNSIDSKIMGQTSPPPEVESFLGESSLYLRDANWDPNFASSSKNISRFIREALNQPVDGLISINYNQVREILTIFGGLDVPAYGGEVTAQNLYSRLEMNAAEEQDRDREQNIHTTLLDSLIGRMGAANDEEINQLMALFHRSLRSQDVALYLENPGVGGVMSELGWTGSIAQPECPANFGTNCKTNYIYQVEANVGVNKVNQYVTSGVNHSISIEENTVSHHRKIRYENRAHTGIWPLGDYKAYIRFYVDSDAKLEEIRFNNEPISEDLITQYIDHNRQIFGILINVPRGEQLNVDLHYSTPLSVQAGGSYFFFEQSQPGVSRRLSTISLNHPEELESELISPMVDVNQNQIVVASDVGAGFVAIKFADSRSE